MFGIIGLVLVGLVVGGVRLLKTRDNSYATQHAPVAPTNKPASNTPQAQPSKPPAPQQASPSVKVAPPASQQQSQVAVTQSGQNNPSTPASASLPHNVPNTTAISPGGLFATSVLMLMAAFFGRQLLKARASYRRYLQG